METKRRGRPPGSFKKVKEVEKSMFDVSGTPKKRGRKAIEKLESASFVAEVPLEGEIEGTANEKLKNLAKQVKYMDFLLDKEPYRIDIRLKKSETISRMCFLIEGLA